ncbi:MAG: F0F1 ATP synthase subunit A [Deltaproteobacteria bacterium]|nr:F0F1 ATP synthase subunit A [Deltaproteobacteria bacterium]
MEELTNIWQEPFSIFGYHNDFMFLNMTSLIMTWIVMVILILFSYLATKKAGLIPHPVQVVAEFLVNIFYNLVVDTLDEEKAKKYFPMICSLFMFFLLCNWIGAIPMMAEPTRDLNTTLGMGILGGIVSHYSGIRVKGIKGYLKEYCSPMWFMAPLNFIGEIAQVVSVSFRLYGNILGGAIIILIGSQLLKSILVPPFLVMYFGLFVGTVQAFVFTMLTLVYISLKVK